MKDSNLAVKESLTTVALDHSGEATDMVAEQAEPVAWLYDWDHEGEIVTGWVTQDFETTKFNNGHNVRPLYAAPVRTKDLTDDEKDEIECALNMAHSLLCFPVDSIAEMYCFGMGDCDEVRQQLNEARAVIAADREKNKC